MTLCLSPWQIVNWPAGIKHDSLAALRTAPLQLATLFSDDVLKRAEEDIVKFENKGYSLSQEGSFLPLHPDKRTEGKKSDKPACKNIGGHGQGKRQRNRSYYSSQPA